MEIVVLLWLVYAARFALATFVLTVACQLIPLIKTGLLDRDVILAATACQLWLAESRVIYPGHRCIGIVGRCR